MHSVNKRTINSMLYPYIHGIVLPTAFAFGHRWFSTMKSMNIQFYSGISHDLTILESNSNWHLEISHLFLVVKFHDVIISFLNKLKRKLKRKPKLRNLLLFLMDFFRIKITMSLASCRFTMYCTIVPFHSTILWYSKNTYNKNICTMVF